MPVIHRVRVDFNIPGHPTQQQQPREKEITPYERSIRVGLLVRVNMGRLYDILGAVTADRCDEWPLIVTYFVYYYLGNITTWAWRKCQNVMLKYYNDPTF